MKSILDVIKSSADLSEDQHSFLSSNIQTKKITKGQILQSKGDLADRIFFVKSGLLRSYAIDANGKEHVFIFAPEGWLISDTGTITSKEPSDLFIDAIEESEIEICNKEIFIQAAATHANLSLTRSDKLIKRIAVLQKRVIMLMSASAKERYQHFLETYPNIVQRVPQKMIASYLGITPEALSKIRGVMAKNK